MSLRTSWTATSRRAAARKWPSSAATSGSRISNCWKIPTASAMPCSLSASDPKNAFFFCFSTHRNFSTLFSARSKLGPSRCPVNTQAKPQDYEYILNDCRARVALVSEPLLPHLQSIPKEKLRYLQEIVVSEVKQDVSSRRYTDFAHASLSAKSDGHRFSKTGSRAHQQRRARVLAVLLRKHGRVQRLRASPSRHGGVLRVVRQRHFANEGERPLLQRRAIVFCLRARKCRLLPSWLRRHNHSFSRASRRPPRFTRISSAIARRSFFPCPQILRHCLRIIARTGASSISRACATPSPPANRLPAPLFHRFKERFGVEILDSLGSTETLQMVIANRPGEAKPGSSGKIIPGYEARIVDEHGNAVAPNEIGDLLIKGDSTCSGYWNKHEKTKETFVGDWFRTGDKYFQDEERLLLVRRSLQRRLQSSRPVAKSGRSRKLF